MQMTGSRLAYRFAWPCFVLYAIGRIPARTGFRMTMPSCSVAPTGGAVLLSFGNVTHVVLFALFYVLTYPVTGGTARFRHASTAGLTLLFGVIIELEQGATRTGNCELVDLIPDAIGAGVGALLVLIVDGARRRLTSAARWRAR